MWFGNWLYCYLLRLSKNLPPVIEKKSRAPDAAQHGAAENPGSATENINSLNMIPETLVLELHARSGIYIVKRRNINVENSILTKLTTVRVKTKL